MESRRRLVSASEFEVASIDRAIFIGVELRSMDRRRMRHERVGHTLQATALVNEVFVRLCDQKSANRKHFFYACGRAMRQIVIDYAKRRSATKRGGDRKRVEPEFDLPGKAIHEDLVALNEVIDQLAEGSPRKAMVVNLHHFAGLTVAETASLLNVSKALVDKDWSFTKAWLRAQMTPKAP